MATPRAFAQLLDPVAAKAVVNCEKNVSNAGRTFLSNSFKSLKKCVDTIFNCVQACPKGIDITRWLSALKRKAVTTRY